MTDVEAVALKLLAYCRASEWKGYDPYDALNSKVFEHLPILDTRIPRLVLTQIFKRSSVNFRPLLKIPKTQNPKAIALFLMALVKLGRLGLLEGKENPGEFMAEKLAALRSSDERYFSWGYSFPWQTRTILVPRDTPNLVCTCFAANALLDAYEGNLGSGYLDMAASAAEYIVNELYWTDGQAVASFSYPLPGLKSQTHNANFLGSALLCRVYQETGEKRFLEPALMAARYSAAKQREDGSWDYGESSTQGWVDNFHTGYNLCALQAISRYAPTTEFDARIRRGFQFYRDHFFREDGAPRYFHNRTYPIDIHSVAQSIITLLAFKELDQKNIDLAGAVFRWAMDHMWDEQGYFYYQVRPYATVKIPYMRWSQAWMLLALSVLLEHLSAATPGDSAMGSGKWRTA